MLKIYTDGSCQGNGREKNIGGYGYVVVGNNKVLESFSSARIKNTTNNRMELQAILTVIQKYGSTANPIIICSDSNYSINTLRTWMYSWQRRGWIKSDKKVPENLDLIKELYELLGVKKYLVEFQKVEGHSDDIFNALADDLANGRK